MVLYTVFCGIVSLHVVERKTKLGFRVEGGRYIKLNTLVGEPNLDITYTTTCIVEAFNWSKSCVIRMSDLKQCANASIDDLKSWIDSGSEEGNTPKPRAVW